MKKTILVTGSDGFVGINLVNELKKQGYIVYTFDKNDGDIAETVLDFQNIEHVFHLAALTFVPASWENPADFYRTNVMGTNQVLELCRKTNCSLTYLSSYVYGIPEYFPIDEKHSIIPNTPYNHSKLLGEELCKFYNKNFGVDVTIFRPFNIYGIGQNKNFLIPTIVSQVLDKETTEIKVQNLSPKRDFLYIDDFISALIKTIELKEFNTFNIGSGKSYSVNEIINFALEISNEQKTIIETVKNRINEVNDVVSDISLIKKILDWEPKFDMKKGLELIIKSN